MVEAPNWIVAMGNGVESLGAQTSIDRLACETLPNGVIIARDVRQGTAYIIREMLEGEGVPVAEVSDPTTEEHLLEVPDAWEEDGAPTPTFEPLSDEPPETIDTTELEVMLDPADDQQVVARLELLQAASTPRGAWTSALALARELIPCEAGAAVAVGDEGALSFVAATGPRSTDVVGLELPSGAGFVGLCIQRRLALNVHDVHGDRRHFNTVDRHTGFEPRSVLCVPVASDDRVFGCLELINPVGQGRFTRAHLETVEMVAGSLAERLGP